MLTKTVDKILVFLASTPKASPTEIGAGAGVNRTSVNRHVKELVEDGLLDVEEGSHNVPYRYWLTLDGMTMASRIIRYEATEGRVVPPARINKFEGVYVPTDGYQRNQGHKSIQSRGFAC